MTDDAWFGVTPEPVAKYVQTHIPPPYFPSNAMPHCMLTLHCHRSQIAWEMSEGPAEKTTLVDLFAGAGGNAIAFALSECWTRIIAVEKDRDTLACAQNNAAIYGVADHITWVHADSFEYLALVRDSPALLHPSLRLDPGASVLFASPPWGGPGYTTDQVFNLHNMEPYNLNQLHRSCAEMDHALYLPRSSDLRQIAKLMPDGKKAELVQYCVEGASKALVAYIPARNSTKPSFYYPPDHV